MIKHFCNACGEETPSDELTPVEATWTVAEKNEPSGAGFAKQRSAPILGKRRQTTAELCPPCIDYLARFLSPDERARVDDGRHQLAAVR